MHRRYYQAYAHFKARSSDNNPTGEVSKRRLSQRAKKWCRQAISDFFHEPIPIWGDYSWEI
ncbi:hypothetical protein ANO14919_030860 [Xylariales sp. No.14919]|nr:hypothetical protein ANO14919_030860 [Xylariales sp. No.14919]